MQFFKYLSEETWNRLPLTDFRGRFFIEVMYEKLRIQTPHFYQARLMNLFSACTEMLVFVQEFSSTDKNGAYISATMKEIEECWDSDPVAQEMLVDLVSVRTGISKGLLKTDSNPMIFRQIEILCRAILLRKSAYSINLLDALKESVLGTTDITQVDRITINIDRLAGLYTTHLLNQGYSATYLFSRVKMLCRRTNYSGRNFPEQFDFIISRLLNNSADFDVYYGIYTKAPEKFLDVKDEMNLSFILGIPSEITGSDLEAFSEKIDISLTAKFRVAATDYVSAAMRGKEQLDKFLDEITALEQNFDVRISAHAYVIFQNQKTVHKRLLSVDKLLAFLSSEAASSFFHEAVSTRKQFGNLTEAATEQFGRSLRYLRLARTSVSIEQKLLNLWISLESLFSDNGSGIIGNVLDFVPSFYANSGLIRRVTFLRTLLVENEVTIIPELTSIWPTLSKFDDSVTDQQVFLLLRSEKLTIALFNSLNEKEHLKFKLKQIFSDLKDNKSILARLNRSQDDVTRQLRRIYFLRNKIAHTGHFKGVRPQLITHLLDYLFVYYKELVNASANAQEEELYSIIELFTASRMGAEVIYARAASKESITSVDQITLMPIM